MASLRDEIKVKLSKVRTDIAALVTQRNELDDKLAEKYLQEERLKNWLFNPRIERKEPDV